MWYLYTKYKYALVKRVEETVICFCCGKDVDIQQLRHGLHERCFTNSFGLEAFIDFSDVIVRSSTQPILTTENKPLRKMASFFHGKFKKYSATLAGTAYILKVKQEGYPELPATEFLCNQIARQLNLEVPSFFFIRFEESLETFVSRNFMQDHPSSNLVHIYHYLKEDHEFTCEHLVQIIGEQTGRLRDIERFVELCLFDSLVGNHDRHGRNLGFIQTAKGLHLSPFFDNPSYLGTETEDLLDADIAPRGTISTSETEKPSMNDYVREFKQLGYLGVITRFKENMSLEKITALIDESFMSPKRKTAILTLLHKRLQELDNGI